jgi:hypothetical protein
MQFVKELIKKKVQVSKTRKAERETRKLRTAGLRDGIVVGSMMCLGVDGGLWFTARR